MILFKYIGTRGFCFWGMNFHNLGGKKGGRGRKIGIIFGGGKSGPKSPHYEEKKILKSPYLENMVQQFAI